MSWLIPRNELTQAQLRTVGLNPREHRVVVGSPGSGKTLVLLHRARHLIDEYGPPDKRYRILVYTNVLKGYIRSALRDLGLPDSCVTTFDSWCKGFHEKHINKPLPRKEDRPDFDAIRQAVWESVTSSLPRVSLPLYDFVMVDEGQDMNTQTYETLKRIAAHVTVFMDHKQQLYDNRADEKNILSTLGLRKRNVQLLDAYRCSPYIVRVAASFIRDPAEREAFIKQNRPVDRGERQSPLCYLADSYEDEQKKLVEALRSRIDRGERIAILFPARKYIFNYANVLLEAGLEVEVPNRRPGSGGIDFSTPVPKLMAYPSAKGLTVDSVFMPCLNLDRFSRPEDERLEKWLFVGITRATKWIYFSAIDNDNVLFRVRFEKLRQDKQLTILENRIPKEPDIRDYKEGKELKWYDDYFDWHEKYGGKASAPDGTKQFQPAKNTAAQGAAVSPVRPSRPIHTDDDTDLSDLF